MSLFIGIESTTLTTADRRRLSHPAVSGVILFTRNFTDTEQLRALTQAIKRHAPNLLISVDHEGGRVQRFRDGFTQLPAMATLGQIFDEHPLLACELSEACGIILAYELRQFGIDFSFAPVLDLQDEQSNVIADRAFHANPAVVTALSLALRQGMRKLGMAAVGKHYPGHGRVQGDSHHTLPSDHRAYSMREADRYPFIRNIHDGIESIMTAHILLPENQQPAGFEPSTLAELRQFGFDGIIFSDDLDMAGAKFFDTPEARVQAALTAGADIAMICNNFADMDCVLAHDLPHHPSLKPRLKKLHLRPVDKEAAKLYYSAARALFQAHLLSP